MILKGGAYYLNKRLNSYIELIRYYMHNPKNSITFYDSKLV